MSTGERGGRTLLAIKMKVSTAGGSWGKKKKNNKKTPRVYPLCDPGDPPDGAMIAERCSATEMCSAPKGAHRRQHNKWDEE